MRGQSYLGIALGRAAARHAHGEKLCEMIRAFDEARGWERDGQCSCKQWLSFRTGMAMSTAYDHVRVARKLAQLPVIDEAFAKGQLSYSKVRAMTRVADESNDRELMEAGCQMSGAELELHCRGLRLREQGRGERPPERTFRQRTLGDGSVELRIHIGADEAELVMKTLREVKRTTDAPGDGRDSNDTEHDAAADFEQDDVELDEGECRDHRNVDAFMSLVHNFMAGGQNKGHGGDRTQLLVHMIVDDLSSEGESSERKVSEGESSERKVSEGESSERKVSEGESSEGESSEGESSEGARKPRCRANLHESNHWLSRETFERLSCDCSVVVAKTDEAGNVLNIGRSRRTIPPAIRRAMLVQGRSCSWPGCAHHAFLDAHHLIHWGDRGETKLSNLVFLCHSHHFKAHEGGFTISRHASAMGLSELVFRRPDGTRIEHRGTAVTHEPVELLHELNQDIDAKSAPTRHQPNTATPLYELALSALRRMGFKNKASQSVLDQLRRSGSPPRDVKALMLASLALLVP